MRDVITYFIPLFIIAGLLVVLAILALLGRIQGGRFLRPIMQFLLKVPLLGPWLKRMSESALEKQNPELASAVKKLERMGANKDPMRAQQALSQLSAAERKAITEAAGQQMPIEAMNRQQRRKLERQRKRS
jgi:hypothetical protein